MSTGEVEEEPGTDAAAPLDPHMLAHFASPTNG